MGVLTSSVGVDIRRFLRLAAGGSVAEGVPVIGYSPMLEGVVEGQLKGVAVVVLVRGCWRGL